MFKFFFTVLIVLQLPCLNAQKAKTSYSIDFKVKDNTKKFLAFYDSATKNNLAEQERWLLWKSMYGFAAVPPTPQGDSIARSLLNKAWQNYPSAIPLIKTGADVISADAKQTLDKIALLLRPDSALDITLLAYVGGFEGNAFNMARNRKVTTAVAIETPMPKRSIIMAHELAHAVHIGMGSMSGDWQRTVGAIAISEGVAMHISKKLLPKFSNKDITEHTPGWFADAEKRRNQILQNILPVISSSDLADVMRFTMGTGPSGLEREAYYAGWVIVGYRLKQGMSLAEIAHIAEQDMPALAKETIEQILQREQK